MAELSQLDITQVTEWLNKHWRDGRQCPICQNSNWNISNMLYEFRVFHDGNLVIGGPVYPAVAVTCNVCGHTLFFNALKIGIIKSPQGEDKKNG